MSISKKGLSRGQIAGDHTLEYLVRHSKLTLPHEARSNIEPTRRDTLETIGCSLVTYLWITATYLDEVVQYVLKRGCLLVREESLRQDPRHVLQSTPMIKYSFKWYLTMFKTV